MFAPVGYLRTLAASCKQDGAANVKIEHLCADMMSAASTTNAPMSAAVCHSSQADCVTYTTELALWDDYALEHVQTEVNIKVPVVPSQLSSGKTTLVLQKPSACAVEYMVVTRQDEEQGMSFRDYLTMNLNKSEDWELDNTDKTKTWKLDDVDFTLDGCVVDTNTSMTALVSQWRSVPTNDPRLFLVKSALKKFECYVLRTVVPTCEKHSEELTWLAKLPRDAKKFILALQDPDSACMTWRTIGPPGQEQTLRERLEHDQMENRWGVSMESVIFFVHDQPVHLDISLKDLLAKWREVVGKGDAHVLVVKTRKGLCPEPAPTRPMHPS